MSNRIYILMALLAAVGIIGTIINKGIMLTISNIIYWFFIFVVMMLVIADIVLWIKAKRKEKQDD